MAAWRTTGSSPSVMSPPVSPSANELMKKRSRYRCCDELAEVRLKVVLLVIVLWTVALWAAVLWTVVLRTPVLCAVVLRAAVLRLAAR